MLTEDAFRATQPRATLYLPGEMPEEQDAWMAAFHAMMADCPSAAGCGIPIEDGRIQITHSTDRQWEVTLRWLVQEASAREMSKEELKAFFGKVAPEYRYRGDKVPPPVDRRGRGDAPRLR
jgi:hypothetical protein